MKKKDNAKIGSAMANVKLTTEEFYKQCALHGFTRPLSCRKVGGPQTHAAYSSMDGANTLYGHDGKFYVPPKDDLAFLSLCARTVLHGNLCISMQVNPAPDALTPPVAPFFFDVDWLMDKMTSEVAHMLFRLMDDSRLLTNDVWLQHVGVPSQVAARFPQCTDAERVFAQLRTNFDEPSQDLLCLQTIGQLMLLDTECQNWLNKNLGTAIAVIAQRRVIAYYKPSVARRHFNCYVFSNYTEEPGKCKIGVHVHFDLLVIPVVAHTLYAGIREHFDAEYGLGVVFDELPIASSIRMPFTKKPLVDPNTKKRKRVKTLEGDATQVVLVNRWYAPVVRVDATTGTVDMVSQIGGQFAKGDILTALVASSIRSSAHKPTDGFHGVGLPTTSWQPPIIVGMDMLHAADLPVGKVQQIDKYVRQLAGDDAATVERLREALSLVYSTLPRNKQLQQQRFPNPSHFRIISPLLPVYQQLQTGLPPILGQLMSPVFSNLVIRSASYTPPSNKLLASPAHLRVFTANVSACYNREPRLPSCHSKPGTVWFHLESTLHPESPEKNVRRITQRCTNAKTAGSRVDRTTPCCKEWAGHMIDVTALSQRLARQTGEQIRALYDQLFYGCYNDNRINF